MLFLILFFKGYKWYKKKILQKNKKTSAIKRVKSKLKALNALRSLGFGGGTSMFSTKNSNTNNPLIKLK